MDASPSKRPACADEHRLGAVVAAMSTGSQASAGGGDGGGSDSGPAAAADGAAAEAAAEEEGCDKERGGTLAPAGALHHASSTFMSLMHLRLSVVTHLLRRGLGVWLTDVDAIFNVDPFLLIRAQYQAEFGYDTPFLPKGKDSPLMVMAGFFYMRDCVAYPSNCALLDDTVAHQRAHPTKHDQAALNAVLASRQGEVRYGVLDPLLFPNGALFFSERAPQMMGIKAAAVQANHITGVLPKRHRLREHLLWYLDPPSYYQGGEDFSSTSRPHRPCWGSGMRSPRFATRCCSAGLSGSRTKVARYDS